MNNFIQTTDAKTADILRRSGFPELEPNSGFYTFVFSKKLNFVEDIDITKVRYTNMLYL